jgi:hypothetical protein
MLLVVFYSWHSLWCSEHAKDTHRHQIHLSANAGSYVFAGVPEATLCSQYPNFQPDYKIGAGTQFPTASSFGSSISGNVHIVGDFQVDETFTFTNATVKVDVGRAILVGTSNGLSGGNHLTISGSKFFACDDMWRV